MRSPLRSNGVAYARSIAQAFAFGLLVDCLTINDRRRG
jgi:hypothetical protein